MKYVGKLAKLPKQLYLIWKKVELRFSSEKKTINILRLPIQIKNKFTKVKEYVLSKIFIKDTLNLVNNTAIDYKCLNNVKIIQVKCLDSRVYSTYTDYAQYK